MTILNICRNGITAIKSNLFVLLISTDFMAGLNHAGVDQQIRNCVTRNTNFTKQYIQLRTGIADLASSAYRADRPAIRRAEASVLVFVRVNILDLKILQVFFKNRGKILVFEFFFEFLEFFGFTLCFRTFQAKKIFSKFFRLIEKFHCQSIWINYMNW